MAGKFPLSYSNDSTYGSVEPNINPYYYVHNADNTNIYSDNVSAFDVYTFNETATEDSPQRSFSVILIKNTGAADSDLNISEITLSDAALSSAANWSLIQEVGDLNTSSAFGANGCLSPAEYTTLLTGSNNGNSTGVVMSSPAPILYLNINGLSGDVNQDSFGTGTEKYIPVFNPSDIVNDSNLISATEISSVVYPEYAAFMIECDPTENFSVLGADVPETLTIGAVGFSSVVFHLNATGFSTGELEYIEGNATSVDGNNFTFTPLTVNSQKEFESDSVAGLEQPLNLNPTYPNYTHNVGLSVTSSIVFPYMPYGLEHISVLAHHNKSVIKISDNTANTGGVRFSPGSSSFVFEEYGLGAGLISSTNTNAYIKGSNNSSSFK